MKPRIAGMGAGAVGGYVGGHLSRLGHDITLIDAWPEHVETVRAQGLNLYGMTEEERCTVRLPILHLTEVQSFVKQRPVDIAVISVKSYDTEGATLMMRQYLAPGGFVCLGHSESMSRMSSLFVPRRFPDAILYQKPVDGGAA